MDIHVYDHYTVTIAIVFTEQETGHYQYSIIIEYTLDNDKVKDQLFTLPFIPSYIFTTICYL